MCILFTEHTSKGLTITGYVGWTTTIPCHPRVPNDVDWKYRPTKTGFEDYIYSNGVMYDRFRDRMSVDRTTDGDYNLIISNTNLSDTGFYICIEELGLGDGYIYNLTVSGTSMIFFTYLSL